MRTKLIIAGLIALNLLSYLDRQLLPSALPVMQGSMQVSDVEIGSTVSWFFFAYMWGAPLLGWIGDRLSRPVLVLICCLTWSVLLGASTFMANAQLFRCAYSLTGLAMGGFSVFGIAMLSDVAPPSIRSRALSWFILSMTAGRAIGFPVGGWLSQTLSWRTPFQVCAVAGVLLALLLAFVFPLIGTTEIPQMGKHVGTANEPFRTDLLRQLLMRSYLIPVLGLAMHTFALGGLNAWLPMLLCREAGFSPATASTLLGSAILSGGTIGTWVGGALGDRLLHRTPKALHWVSASGLFLAVPCVGAILLHNHIGIVCGIFGLQFSLGCALSPLNAALLNAVPEAIRATGVAVAILIIHALGDVPSPRLIGIVSDQRGLSVGVSITIIALTIGGLLLSATRLRPASANA